MQKKQDKNLSSSFQEDYFLYLTMAVSGLPWMVPGQEQRMTDHQNDTTSAGPEQTVEAATGS